jgi:hypothetical protein
VTGVKLSEYYALSGGLILLLLFSVSGFQLPFYTNIIFPLFAVVTAGFCYEQLNNKAEQVFRLTAQWLYIVLFPLVIFMLHYFLQPASSFYLWLAVVVLVIAAILIFRTTASRHIKVFLLSCTVMVFVAFYVNSTLYPVIIGDKAQIKAAEYINSSIPANQVVYSLRDQNNIFQFYCDRPVGLIRLENFATTPSAKGAVFYADQEAMDNLAQNHIPVTIISSWLDYPQENILPAFINHNTRNSTLQKAYLITKP